MTKIAGAIDAPQAASRSGAAGVPKGPSAGNTRNDPAAGGQSLPQAGSADVHQAVSRLNDHIQKLNRELQFSVDKASGRTIIKVVDPKTKEVVREIPPKEVLALARAIGREGGVLLKVQA
ncbi:MAG TPA: flagellar protein FlaG [Gammaproteobacteria bacterium]|nr:flagellar protein FlaG [Gammaproteobacteria bacterium]